ncbi:MAG: 6,7-dimethyl-8-ribityllumazine synthase [Candidatus Gracilibacteria bacterium]|jgi:6,7-dimethyl-8-ribityllumazine synthase
MIGVIVSEFNDFVTEKLLESCERGLNELKLEYKIVRVPGAFEIPLMAKKLSKKCSAIIALGCLIKGKTDHYDMVCRACVDGIMRVQLATDVPIVFEVLMVRKMGDAMMRVEKGYNAVLVASKLLNLNKNETKNPPRSRSERQKNTFKSRF